MIDLKKYKQEQLVRFWDSFSEYKKKQLFNQINNIDFEFMEKLYKNSYFDEEIDTSKISNLKILSETDNDKYEKAGINIIKNNEYGVILMAGGFASRLGIEYPKGCVQLKYNGKTTSLFELFVNQLKDANKKYNSSIKLYIMTSTKNNNRTIKFFEKNNYFDYNKDNIKFFSQDNLPILDVNGKMVLRRKNQILFGPNGNGDVFNALKKNNLIEDIKRNNIKYLLFSTIDNVVSNLVDTTFIGATIENGYKLSSKTLTKKDSSEKDWIFCKYNNKPFMLPTNYIDEEITNKKDNNDNYIYREKNITYHLISTDYVEKFSNIELKYHRAYKKNKFLDKDGNLIFPKSPNSFKFEKFIFDAFYYADDMLLYRVNENSFCPIKTKKDIKKAEIALENKNVQ